jgi:putative transposase
MVRTAAADRLKELFPEDVSGYVVDRQMILDTLIYAAAERKSLHSACASLSATANDDTIRNYLNAAFKPGGIYEMQQAVNRSLLAELPRRVRKGRWNIAIDMHDQPYYGHCDELEPWVCQSKSKHSTKRFLRIATAYVIKNGLRITVAMRVVRPNHSSEDAVGWLVHSLRRAGIGIRRLWMDKGFASGGVVRRIKSMRLSAIIACPIQGEEGGTRALCSGRGTHGAFHTFNSRRHGRWTSYISVVRAFVKAKGRRKAKRAACRSMLAGAPSVRASRRG